MQQSISYHGFSLTGTENTRRLQDQFPPLVGAAVKALYISERALTFKSNRKHWADFVQFIQEGVSGVIMSLYGAREPSPSVKLNTWMLLEALAKVETEIDAPWDVKVFRRIRSIRSSIDRGNEEACHWRAEPV
ncbi:hypothetical protein FIBSPDRAFT_186045 [Athelia psychrophila]|uniref:Uncharacterized protein n=1 Tax=Athelia psychrophila TaxID=1759441 RepID=A0A166AAW7_9AGAM|nr:hypothetical protein FIBSPDRAFT_186045 [Fibularhizoctonia sp. CBS 109695]